jgi:hypothetical protein
MPRHTASLELQHTHIPTSLNAFAAVAGRHDPLAGDARTGQNLRLRRENGYGTTPPLAARPKTHQNLIHPDKEQTAPTHGRQTEPHRNTFDGTRHHRPGRDLP